MHPETRRAWRAWLAAHHASSSGVWLVMWKKHTGQPAMGYEASVEEALCYGWVDSTQRRLDGERSMQWFAPRRWPGWPAAGCMGMGLGLERRHCFTPDHAGPAPPHPAPPNARRRGSVWSRLNKQRVARLAAARCMAPAGLAAVAAAQQSGAWSALDAAEDLLVPEDLQAAFARHPGSRARWDAFPPSARRSILSWIALAKRDTTRAKRAEETAALAARGERANQGRPREAPAAA